MKNSMYFPSVDAMNEYFPAGVPSNVLAIVQQPVENASAVLYTSSNNQPVGGGTEEQGGYIDSPEEKVEKAEALSYTEVILDGNDE